MAEGREVLENESLRITPKLHNDIFLLTYPDTHRSSRRPVIMTTHPPERNYEMKAEFRMMRCYRGLSSSRCYLPAQASAHGGNPTAQPNSFSLPCLLRPYHAAGAAACTTLTSWRLAADTTHCPPESPQPHWVRRTRYACLTSMGQHSFMQSPMRCPNRYFYDPSAAKYTVDRYL